MREREREREREIEKERERESRQKREYGGETSCEIKRGFPFRCQRISKEPSFHNQVVSQDFSSSFLLLPRSVYVHFFSFLLLFFSHFSYFSSHFSLTFLLSFLLHFSILFLDPYALQVCAWIEGGKRRKDCRWQQLSRWVFFLSWILFSSLSFRSLTFNLPPLDDWIQPTYFTMYHFFFLPFTLFFLASKMSCLKSECRKTKNVSRVASQIKQEVNTCSTD